MPQVDNALMPSEKPLAGPERRALEMKLAGLKHAGRKAVRHSLTGQLIAFVVLCGLTLLLSDAPPPIVLSFWLAIMALIGVWIAIDGYLRGRTLSSTLRRTLASGRVREVRIVASGVVEFEEESDFGAYYAFQIADDRIVFIWGQEFYATSKFPNSDFALIDVLDPDGERVDFFIRKSGQKLEPIRTIPVDVQRRLQLPEHLRVMEGKLAQLERLLAA